MINAHTTIVTAARITPIQSLFCEIQFTFRHSTRRKPSPLCLIGSLDEPLQKLSPATLFLRKCGVGDEVCQKGYRASENAEDQMRKSIHAASLAVIVFRRELRCRPTNRVTRAQPLPSLPRSNSVLVPLVFEYRRISTWLQAPIASTLHLTSEQSRGRQTQEVPESGTFFPEFLLARSISL